jgi:preprotein translocase subunit Sec61beta
MAQDNRVRIPSGMGGLTNYNEIGGSKLRIKPTAAIIIIGVIAVIVILMHAFL